jgi:2',3'-cyclic-nucleotide 2'-phosphodiesterase (5'-nucleotidase family)
MPDEPAINPNDKPIEPGHPKSNTRGAEKLTPFTSKIGVLDFLLGGLVLLVILNLYLGSRQISANTSKPTAQLIIIQLNDIYRLDAVRAGKRGGLARVVNFLRQQKEQNPQVPVIVLHAGDFLSPSLESDLLHGSQMIDAMNFINNVAPLYVVAGNHEFDYSDDPKRNESAYLTDAILKSKFLWVASNLERNEPNLLPALRDNVSQHFILPFGKLKVGIFGLTLDAAQRGKDRTYAPISGDYGRIARAEIEYLEREGSDLIVGLTHLNIEDDRELAKLKQEHPRFRWIAGGHEHTWHREPAWSGGALITKGDSNARTIWKVTVVRNGQDIDVHEESIPLDESIQPDPAFTQDIEKFYRAKLREIRRYLDIEISAFPNQCYNGTEEAIRDGESDWGDLLTDAMRTASREIPIDIAVLNGGSIRVDDTICERINFENFERTFAYPTPIVLVEITGKDLREHVLENSVGSKRGDGRFLQVSGVSFRREPTSDGKMVIKDLQIQSDKGQTPFDDNKPYVVAVNQYILGGGDNYDFRQYVTRYICGPDLRSLTYATLSAKTKSPPKVAGRIIDLPEYVKLPSLLKPNWKILTAAEPCAK